MFVRALLAFLALPGVVAFAVPIWIGLSSHRAPRHLAAAVIALICGTTLLLWSVREFYVAGRGTLAAWSPPIRLVTTGPYRWSRNPMYVGVVTILVGWSILWQSPMLAIYTACVASAFYARVRLAEEPWALRKFGAEWEAYRSKVPRWIF